MTKKRQPKKVETGADMISRMINELEMEEDRCDDLKTVLQDLPPLGDKPVEDAIADLRRFLKTDGPRTFAPALVAKLEEFVSKFDALREEYLG